MSIKNVHNEAFAIVIGDWHFNSLGLIRSLGEKGITVYFINYSDFGYGKDSKYTKKTYYAKSDSEALKLIKEIVKSENKSALLFPASDKSALFVDNKTNELKDICICPGLRGKASEYMKKDVMCKLAKEAGFTVPDFFTSDAQSFTVDKGCEFGFPFIIKPLRSVDGEKSDIIICRNKAECENAVASLQDNPEKFGSLLIQRYVSGKQELMVEYCGCKIPQKKVELYGQLEKQREYPPGRGSTSFATIKEDITFTDTSVVDRFLEAVGFDGIFDLEIKVVDSIPYFLEINFRNGAPSYAYTVGGHNIAYEWFCYHTGKAPDKISFRKTTLMSERDDLNNVIDKNIPLLKWLRDLRHSDTLMVFNKRDRLPFIKAYNKVAEHVVSLLTKTI